MNRTSNYKSGLTIHENWEFNTFQCSAEVLTHSFFLLLFLLGIRMTFYFLKLHINVPIPYNQFCLSVFFPGKDPGGDKCGIFPRRLCRE